MAGRGWITGHSSIDDGTLVNGCTKRDVEGAPDCLR